MGDQNELNFPGIKTGTPGLPSDLTNDFISQNVLILAETNPSTSSKISKNNLELDFYKVTPFLRTVT